MFDDERIAQLKSRYTLRSFDAIEVPATVVKSSFGKLTFMASIAELENAKKQSAVNFRADGSMHRRRETIAVVSTTGKSARQIEREVEEKRKIARAGYASLMALKA
jgi:hypothetical protein